MKRVLITGVSRFWGGQLARSLEQDSDIEQIIAIDTEGPCCDLSRTDFVRADLRHSLIGKLIRAVEIDTVFHAGLIIDPQRLNGRAVHETNVIGTINLLAACSGPDSPVQRLVVKSSAAVYGAAPRDPSFWSEAMELPAARDGYTRDLQECESYVHEFRLRNPGTKVSLLRFASILGQANPSPFTRLFELPAVPTVFGFDPRLQFLHEEDVVAAMAHAARSQASGTYNIAGSGITILSQAIQMMGKLNLPIIPFYGAKSWFGFVKRIGLLNFPPYLISLLQYGRVLDTTLMRDELHFAPRHTTLEVVGEYAKMLRARQAEPVVGFTYDGDLEAFLKRKAGGQKSSRTRGETPVSV